MLLVAALFLLASFSAQAGPTVIVLSFDGLRHDYPERSDVPALDRMEREGMRAGRMRPVFPSNTFPNHVSLATGTYPDRHGILDNRFWDREKGLYNYGRGADESWLEAEPLWAAAERQGVRAATFFWVGSDQPWRGQAVHYNRAPFDSDVPESEKVDQILAWLDLPEGERPGLIMSWWHGADAEGHRYGPDSVEVVAALEGQDAELGRLLLGIDERAAWTDLTLIVVSDHGMVAVSDSVLPRELLSAEGIRARVEAGSSVAHVFLEKSGDLARAESRLTEVEGLVVYRGDALPPSLRIAHPQRNGDLVLLVEPPLTFYEPEFWAGGYLRIRRLWDPGASLGMHGYDPKRPDMGAAFYALGRGVAPDSRHAEVRSIDVASTVARLLAIEPPAQNEGVPIPRVGTALD